MVIPGFRGEMREQEPLSRHVTWRVGGPARLFAVPEDGPALAAAISFAAERQMSVFRLGCGSNVLFDDAGYDGIVIRLGQGFSQIVEIGYEADGVRLYAGAAVRVRDILPVLFRLGLTGLEFLAGVPATIGGAVAMNAGAYGTEIGELVESLNLYCASRGFRTVPGEELEFGYRRTALAAESFVTGAVLTLHRAPEQAIRAKVRENMQRRMRALPMTKATCGSVFRNPPGDSAGRLIDTAGLKGSAIGGARVSPVHGNVIENTGGASASDIRALIDQIIKRVHEHHGVQLHTEVVIPGPGGGRCASR